MRSLAAVLQIGLFSFASLAACRVGHPDLAAVAVGRSADAQTLDPARVTDAESVEVTEQVFEQLVRYRADSTEIEPALAVRWEATADGREWTFWLRRGVYFHDGTPLDADAVVFSLERQRDARHSHHQSEFIYGETSFRHIEKIEKLDRSTVKIRLDRPYAPFLANLAMFPASIVSPQAVRLWGAEFDRHPVGTGPFIFSDWSPGERITLRANHAYWGTRPKIEVLTFVVIRDARQRLIALEGGGIDVAQNLLPEDLQFVELHPDLKLYRIAGDNVAYLAMNMDHLPFQDLRVRKAVNQAVNKRAIVQLIYQGLAQPATGALPPSVWGHLETQDVVFDVSEARRLLSAAHWRPNVRPKLYVMNTARSYMPTPELLGRIVQRNLLEIGMDVELVVNDMDEHVRLVQAGRHDLCLIGWAADNLDPDNFLYTLFDSDSAVAPQAKNVAFYRNAEVHKLLLQAQESSDVGVRRELYVRAQKVVHAEMPWVPLVHAEVVIAARRAISGLSVHPSSIVYFQKAQLQ